MLRKGKANSTVWMISLIVVFVSISHCKTTDPLELRQADHHFIDRRRIFLDIPNTCNVISAMLYSLSGLYGLHKVITDSSPTDWENGIWSIGAMSSVLLGVANAYYFLSPGNERLHYKFIFATFQRAALFAYVIYTNLGPKFGEVTFLPIVLYGLVGTGYFVLKRNLRMYFILQTMYTTILPIITRGKNAALPLPWLFVFSCHFVGLMMIHKELHVYIRTTGRVSGTTVGNVLLAMAVVFAFRSVRRGQEEESAPELAKSSPEEEPAATEKKDN